eukprot:jgi/Bigna1/77205/fgenesh1_pg.46_\
MCHVGLPFLRKATIVPQAHASFRGMMTVAFGKSSLNEILQKVEDYKDDKFFLKDFAGSLPTISDNQVFANADCALQHIKHYGFDYDFTLATYNKKLPHLIYDLAKRRLVEKFGYPIEVESLKYDPNFAIRGLHIDKETGMLLKLDQYNKIQLPLFKGRSPVTTAETVRTYGGLRVSRSYVRENMHMMKDLFALPEACLYADVMELLISKNQPFEPSYVQDCVCESSFAICFCPFPLADPGYQFGDWVVDPARYLDPNPNLVKYLTRIRESGRSTFLLTNSPYYFVDAGMKYLMGDLIENVSRQLHIKRKMKNEPLGLPCWTHLFDIVIVEADKPTFYHQRQQRFRKLNPDGSPSLEAVDEFVRGEVYTGGGLEEFHRLSGYRESNVIYMGDQIYSDLVEPQKATQWKTAAIIKEVAHEIKEMNCIEFKEDVARLMFVERLVSEAQIHSEDAQHTIEVGCGGWDAGWIAAES